MIESFKWSINEISNVLNHPEFKENTEINGISWDSREEGNGHCFVCIRGERFDGCDFVYEAIKNGAGLIISDRKLDINVPSIRVENGRAALCDLAKDYIFKKKTKIIAITGSVGKTTVKEMTNSVLSVKYKTLCTVDNENNEIGVSKTLLSVTNEDFCIVEMGMRALGEIRLLSEMCKPDTAVITNCGNAHIGRLGSLENIFSAKSEVLEYTKKYCILPFEKRFITLSKGKLTPIYVGDTDGDLYAKSVVSGNDEIEFSVVYRGENCGRIHIPTFSQYNTLNSLNAYAVGMIYGLNHNEIQKGLSRFRNIGMREKLIDINGITLILECYNASYDGMRCAIKSFVEVCKVKKLTPCILLGPMRETGDFEEEYHYRIGEFARDSGICSLIAYGDNSKLYTDGFCGGITFRDKKSLAEYILNNYGTTDALLVKGSRSEHLEDIVNEMKELVK